MAMDDDEDEGMESGDEYVGEDGEVLPKIP